MLDADLYPVSFLLWQHLAVSWANGVRGAGGYDDDRSNVRDYLYVDDPVFVRSLGVKLMILIGMGCWVSHQPDLLLQP